MPAPDQDRLDAISEALVRLIQRQDALEARFRQLEAWAGFKAPPEPPRPEPAPIAPPPLPPPVAEPAPPILESLPIPAPSREPGLETQVGLNWINRIAVITLIFGSAFFFKYAVDNNWIGPGARVALGVAAAMAALFFGDRMWHRGHKVFAQGLTGFGLALLYLSFYATFGFYHLLPQGAAFFLMVLTTVAGGVFALRYESQAIAVLGVLGGYLTPVMLSTGEDHPWILFSYTFLLNLAGLALARVRRWQAIEYVALVATFVLYTGWYLSWFGNSSRTVATVFAVAFWVQFATSESRIVWLLTQLAAGLGAAAIWDTPANFLLLELLFAAGGLVVAHLRRWNEAPSWTLLCYWLPYLVWTVLNGALQERGTTFGMFSCAFVLFFIWIVWWAVLQKNALRSTDLVVLATNGAAYFGASYYLLNSVYRDYMGLFAAALGAVHLLAAKLLWNPEVSEERDRWPALLAVSVTLSFLTLAIPIQFAGFRITIAWALEGAALAWLGTCFQTEKLKFCAWLVLLLVLLRLFIFDAWIYPNGQSFTAIVNARFMTFVVSAVSLWLAARFAGSGIPAAAPYVAGHFVMLWILGMEVIGWAERSVTLANVTSVETTAISILMALYAVILVAIGVLTRTGINRMMGLGLMGVVVAKLYLSDVWELGRIFRITAFLGLGVLLLVVSYLYSRFKPVIEKLWKAG